MTELSNPIERRLADSTLPLRLRKRTRETLIDREVDDTETADEIIQAVESQYERTRVDPLEPVGTVSAQSIGEPGTQMSIPADERVIVRQDGQTMVTEIGPLIDGLMTDQETITIDEHEVTHPSEPLEVLSLRDDEQVAWKPVQEVSRHDAPDELLKFTLESGREIRATKAHSFVTRSNNRVVPVSGEDLSEGDWLPIVAEFDGVGERTFDLRGCLPRSDYWFTSTLTDGGAQVYPGDTDQIRNKQQALNQGDIDTHTVYPRHGTVGLPEQFPLDEDTGFFIGAFLAEGNLTEYYVSISNVDRAFQERVRSFASRFGLSVNEYENTSGFAKGYDIRINGKILADLLRGTCIDNDQKQVPDFAFDANEEFVRGLLAGYFSGDGNVSSSAVRASSTDEKLIEGIALLLARCSIYATRGTESTTHTLRVPTKFIPQFAERISLVGNREEQLTELAASIPNQGPDSTDQIPNFGDALKSAASAATIPARHVNSAHKRQRIGRARLKRLVAAMEESVDGEIPGLDQLQQAVSGDVVWDRIDSIETVSTADEYVYDFSVAGLETFTTAQGVVTHNTMNTFHYAGVAEIDVTQGLPRLIELVDARKEPDTPMMTIYLEGEYATDREKAHEVVWNIEATKILSLGDVSTNVADMRVRITLNEETLTERRIEPEAIRERIESELGVEAVRDGTVIEFGPEQPSYRQLLQLVEELRDIVFKGIEDITRVVIRKEDLDDGEQFVLYTEGSSFGDVLEIEGVDGSRTITNDIHEIQENLGVEASREAIINETKETLEEQGLDDVNVRHLMLVADIMTNTGEISSIGRHGISGAKESVLARAAFEVTVNHLLDAAIHGEVDTLTGVTENVIVGKPIKLGTGDVNLRVGTSGSD